MNDGRLGLFIKKSFFPCTISNFIMQIHRQIPSLSNPSQSIDRSLVQSRSMFFAKPRQTTETAGRQRLPTKTLDFSNLSPAKEPRRNTKSTAPKLSRGISKSKMIDSNHMGEPKSKIDIEPLMAIGENPDSRQSITTQADHPTTGTAKLVFRKIQKYPPIKKMIDKDTRLVSKKKVVLPRVRIKIKSSSPRSSSEKPAISSARPVIYDINVPRSPNDPESLMSGRSLRISRPQKKPYPPPFTKDPKRPIRKGTNRWRPRNFVKHSRPIRDTLPYPDHTRSLNDPEGLISGTFIRHLLPRKEPCTPPVTKDLSAPINKTMIDGEHSHLDIDELMQEDKNSTLSATSETEFKMNDAMVQPIPRVRSDNI